MGVSVVIPSYNRAHRLPTAIDSVLAQGWPDVEIILVDDGSVDDTHQVAAGYGDRVRYVYQPNAGVGAARNTGMRHATREFVAFLDSDDRWLPFKLDLQLALFRVRTDVGLVFSDFSIERSEGTMLSEGASLWSGHKVDFPEMTRAEVGRSMGQHGDAWPGDVIECWAGPMYRQLLDELPILTSSVVVRRDLLDASTQYTERVALFEDWEFFARVARRASVGYVTVPTTVNVGHHDPGRVSKCSAVDRAQSYLTLLQRVWLADPEFVARYGAAARSAHGRALLAFAREALLARQRDDARAALETWRRSGFDERRMWAAIIGLCARLGGGRLVLRNILRGYTLTRLLLQPGRPPRGSVNPAT